MCQLMTRPVIGRPSRLCQSGPRSTLVHCRSMVAMSAPATTPCSEPLPTTLSSARPLAV